MYYIPYRKNLKNFSRILRNHSTLSEVLLWNQLKQGKMCGYIFNRQKPLGNYIVDFYCKALNLVIEVDGEIHRHEEVHLKDIQRQKILETLGLSFLRFSNEEVKREMSSVLSLIENFIIEFQKKQTNTFKEIQRDVDRNFSANQ